MRSLMSTGIISPMASMLGPSCGRSWMLSKSSANCSGAVAVVVAVVAVAAVTAVAAMAVARAEVKVAVERGARV